MIYHKLRCIFLHIPRTGGTSIRKALGEIDKPQEEKAHKILSYYKEVNPKAYANYFKFAVVRNPFDKVLSSFIFRKKNFASFEDWLNWVVAIELKNKINVIGTQTHWTGDPPELDYLIRFEELAEGWRNVTKLLGIKKKLPHVNKSGKEQGYRDYYTGWTKHIVAAKFAPDFKYFNYTF